MGWCGLDLSGSGYRQVTGFFAHDNEPWQGICSVAEELLALKDSAVWSWLASQPVSQLANQSVRTCRLDCQLSELLYCILLWPPVTFEVFTGVGINIWCLFCPEYGGSPPFHCTA
jgi:hypothetical protein